ncbi:cuticle protein 19.8-like [Penaeus chinensis]|uniref:cuticle protein 19.8-like n=1 Tax=Penaeus chinensis TaxID=139456 RepID=UPI001FB833CE|nr:cuticle protein 19.8-like [Penaeus chinensis]
MLAKRRGIKCLRPCAEHQYHWNYRTEMSMKVFILLGMVAFAASSSFESYEYRPPRRSSEESYESGEAKYNFNWAVSDDSSSNEFGHQEARDGDHTQGSYYVQLPDGRLQTVKYFVDGDSGYVAEVSYEGDVSYESASFESREYRPRYFYDSNESK